MAMRSSSQSNLENIFWVLKHHSIEKVFFMTLRSIFFSENIVQCQKMFFSMSVIYLHLSYCKFSLFLSIDWVRVQTCLAKGPIPDLPDWTGFLGTKILRIWFTVSNHTKCAIQHCHTFGLLSHHSSLGGGGRWRKSPLDGAVDFLSKIWHNITTVSFLSAFFPYQSGSPQTSIKTVK